ncbi:tetratricopeptide repeat protein [Kitasatospora sp. NPDC004240]
MEFDRLVQVRLSTPGEAKSDFGSGYLVAPRLVLTAAHVLGDKDGLKRGTVTVCRPAPYIPDSASDQEADAADDAGPQFRASIRWYRKDAAVDAALVEVHDAPAEDGTYWSVPESLQDTVTRPPQRWGHLIGTRSHPVTLVGYPLMQYDSKTGHSYDKQINGEISPGSGSLARRYEISSEAPILQPLLHGEPFETGWSGMSGAAVLTERQHGGLLCGVVRLDLKAAGGAILTATPAEVLLADPDFTRSVAEHTPGWRPVLEPVEPAPLLAPATLARRLESPAALLRADAEAAAFHGRDQDRKQLHAWCTQGPPALSARAITGPGGQGKTRLARHLTDLLRGEGWITGHLGSDLTDRDTVDFTTLDTDRPLLIVVDYAETRPQLLRRLIKHLNQSRHRVRLLLLARSDGLWRTDRLSASQETHNVLRATAFIPLAPLLPHVPGSENRTKAFKDAATGLARLLPHVPTLPAHDWAALAAGIRPPADIEHPRYENVLTLQMTALTALLQHGPSPVTTDPDAPAEAVLLDHEKRFWEDSAAAPAFGLTSNTKILGHAVAVAAACGAADGTEARKVTETIPGLPPHTAPTAAEWLASLYPPDSDNQSYWGSLRPDRVAEYHAATTLTGADSPLPPLLAAAAPGQQAQIITVLARAAVAHYNAHRTGPSRQVLHDLNRALDTTTPHPQALLNATAALPHPSHILAPLALRLTQDLAHAERQSGSEPDLAASLTNLGNYLSEVGRRAEALTVAEEAVEIYRRLADPVTGNPAAHEPNLAASLTNLSTCLSQVGRRAEALTVAEEAVEIYRRLADPVTGNPAAHEPNLATSLINLGTYLSAVGRRAEALAAVTQAVEIRRRLADPVTGNPAAHEPNLAHSLASLGTRLSEVGRRAEALTAAEQAVEIYRRLTDPATGDPAAHEPDLAHSLMVRSWVLGTQQDSSRALQATGEAVEIYRRLADPVTGNPAAHEPNLATSLTNLGTRLSEVGRRAEALTAAEQAVEIRRRLADPVTGDPAAHESDLAHSLTDLGTHLSQVGRRAEALTVTEQAVEIYRRLADPATGDPAAHESNLAHSLRNFGTHLSQVGRRAEALTAAEEAVEIRRRLADPATGDPVTHEPDLAHSLRNLGNRLAGAGQRAEALTVTEQAVEIYRRLADPATGDPATHEPEFAHSLSELGIYLSQVGRSVEALTVTEQAVEIRRRLADPVSGDPTAHESNLAASLTNLGNRLAGVGRRAEGLIVVKQAVEIYRRLADPVTGDPAAHESDLAASLVSLGTHRWKGGQQGEALTVTEQAVEIYRRLADPATGDPAAHEPRFATSLHNIGTYLSEAGRQGEALRAEHEAVEIRRRLADPVTGNPAAHASDLAASLANFGGHLWEVGLRAEGMTGIEEAVEIRRRLADPVTGDRAAHGPDLARSLMLWAWVLNAQQDLSQALRVTGEAVEIYRHLITLAPHQFIGSLRTVLSLQADVLVGLGRFQDAQTVRNWLASNPDQEDAGE